MVWYYFPLSLKLELLFLIFSLLSLKLEPLSNFFFFFFLSRKFNILVGTYDRIIIIEVVIVVVTIIY